MFIQAGVNSFDTVMVAGNSAAANADGLVYDVMAAFYTACSSFIGLNYGAGRRREIRRSYLICLGYSFGAGAILGFSLVAFGPTFLTLFTTDAAVIEAGMNHAGEMAQLASWIAPTVVVITNAQREHQAYIDGVEGSARENAMALVALPETGCAVLPITDSCYRIWADFARARGCRVLTYSAGVSAADVQAVREGGDLVLTTPLGVTRFHFSMAGEHAVHDAAAAAAASLAAGVPLEDIACGLASFTPLAGRGKIYRFESGALLIDESYNANPDSMRSAIDVLATMPSPRILVAGEMGELGKRSQDFHEEVLRYAKDKGIDALYLTGKAMKDALGAAGAAAHFYLKREDLTRAVQEAIKTPCTVLVKASHYVGLDAVVRAVTTDPKKGN